jgi:hypothetical protein
MGIDGDAEASEYDRIVAAVFDDESVSIYRRLQAE